MVWNQSIGLQLSLLKKAEPITLTELSETPSVHEAVASSRVSKEVVTVSEWDAGHNKVKLKAKNSKGARSN